MFKNFVEFIDWRLESARAALPPAFCSASPATCNEFRQQQLCSQSLARRAQETAKTNQVKRAFENRSCACLSLSLAAQRRVLYYMRPLVLFQ